MEFGNPIVGSESLIRSAIKSPNYVTGSAGWRIAADGSAEFTGLVVNSAGVQGTIRIENGEIVVRRNSDNEIIAKMFSSGDGGFLTRDPDSDDLEYAELTAHFLKFNKEVSPANTSGEISWFNAEFNVGTQVSSGKRTSSDESANIYITSSTDAILDSPPRVSVAGDSGVECALTVAGNLEMYNSGVGNDIEHSFLINSIDQGRGLKDWNVYTASTATTTTTETVGFTTNTTLFKEDRAFNIHVRLLLFSDVAGDVVNTRTRRNGIAGAILMDSQSTAQIPGNSFTSVIDYNMVVVNDTGADITDNLVITYRRISGTGNVRITATPLNIAYVDIRDIGNRFDYPGALGL